MKKLISMLLAVGMAASLAACGSTATTDSAAASESTADVASTAEAAADTADGESDLAYIQEKGKMTIGYTVYAPMNYTDENGEFVGFDTELATLCVCSWAWSRNLWRSTGIPRSWNWMPRALTASGTA